MDWKLIIFIYFYLCTFQTVKTLIKGTAEKLAIDISDMTPDEENTCLSFQGILLCESCPWTTEDNLIHSARRLFGNLIFSGSGSETFDVIVETKTEKGIPSGDTYSQTFSFNSTIAPISVDVKKGHKYVTIKLKGNNCERKYERTNMYYYSVPEQNIPLTVFDTPLAAPSMSEDRLIVPAKCINNAGFEDKPTITIYYNGTYEIEGSCECKPGFELNGTNCSGCPQSKFKAEIGNGPCVSCSPNAIRLPNGTGCNCAPHFYRAANQKMNYSSICYGPLTSPSNITASNITKNGTSAVLLKWDIGNEGSTTSSGRHFSITCPSCMERKYRFTNVNTTETQIVIHNLMAYVSYTLKIRAFSEIAVLTQIDLSNNVTFTTETGAPGVIENLTHRVNYSRDIIVLTWDPPVERGGPKLKYKFEYGNTCETLDIPAYTLHLEDKQRTVKFKITAAAVFLNGSLVFSRLSHPDDVIVPSLLPKIPPKIPEEIPEKISKSVIVGVIIAVVIFVTILLIVIVVLYRRTKRPKHFQVYRMEDGSLEIYRGQIDKSRIYVDPGSYSQIDHAVYNFTTELRATDLEIGKLIGEGEFADVHKGVLSVNNKKVEVAVKKLRIGCSQKDREDFISEAAILGQFDNPNVIRLEGVILQAFPSILILELMANGSLDKYLKEHHSKLSIHQLLGMARGIASGMKYLSDLGYIHRDLAARNVLIDAQENCKISDFGMSRELKTDETYSTRGGKIPIKWTAPEAIQFKKFTTATDVWSYGILLWEIMAFGERPYWDWPNFEVLERIATGYRLPPPPYCPKAVHDLMLDCWQKDRTKRPLFDAILQQLELWIKDPVLLKETFRESVITKDDEIFDYASVFGSLEDWLEAIKMSQYTSFFQERGFISPKQLMNFTLDDLQDIGIAPIGHRKKILKAIRTTRFQLAGREGRRRTVSRSSSSIGYARSRIAKRFSNLASSLQSGHNSIMEKSFDTHETIIT